ncbi:hypothetical protein IscW_ISCW015365 [Ixodes scapularis]|uniref:Uncharacterized protein n=1 Tax=Ixodes scapularis TaxID=6945 RepID=B7QMZ9_IXOSC|nr:hypothetical protein IscW_ISCW015365 [Ixodes scapularis]|eukprot:XP_002400460.1 hypothetical protein IscW_ISCW015365 [Ixodes scapularis]
MVFKTGATAPVPPPVKLGSLPATANGGGDLTAQMLQQKIEDGATESAEFLELTSKRMRLTK